jgi:hypothetical protein
MLSNLKIFCSMSGTEYFTVSMRWLLSFQYGPVRRRPPRFERAANAAERGGIHGRFDHENLSLTLHNRA